MGICEPGADPGMADAVDVSAGRDPAKGGGNDGVPGDRNRVHRSGGGRRGETAGRARVGSSGATMGNGTTRGKGVQR